MYEKPQYLTPGGYKRASNNPNKSDGGIRPKDPVHDNNEIPLVRKIAAQKKQILEIQEKLSGGQTQTRPAASSTPSRLLKSRKKPAISEKAAMLIAMAIKSMLKD